MTTDAAHDGEIGITSPGASILVVDDDPILRDIAATRLAAGGYDVTCAADGVEAWERLGGRGFDLVVSDIDMPRMNGFDLIDMIRTSPVHRHVPVIVITSFDDPQSVDRAFSSGAKTFVTKPVNWTLFEHQVRYVLRAATLDAALRLARNRAEHLVAQKDAFLSVLSHELRTPLNAIIGFAEVLSTQTAAGIDVKDQQGHVNEILNGGRRLLGSLEDIFLYSQVLSGELCLNEGEHPLSSLAHEIRAYSRYDEEPTDVEVVMTGFDDATNVLCDLRRLGRAISSLVENAVKFSPQGSQVTVTAAASSNGGLTIAIRDRGPGMSDQDVARYLEPFTQSDMSSRRSNEGLGLGLTLAASLLRAHEGQLALDGVPQEGTTARIALPSRRIIERAA